MLRRYRLYVSRLKRKFKKMGIVQENLEVELRKKLINQIQQTTVLKEDKDVSDEVRVHELRKSIKRSRAILRLLKPALDKRSFHALDEILGNSARLLTDQREATVNLRTFIILTSKSESTLPVHVKKQILDRLAWQVDHTYNTSPNNYTHQLESSLFILEKAKIKIEGIPLKSIDENNLSDYIGKTHSKTSKLYKDSLLSLHTETIHNWRKYCKHLLFQLKFSPIQTEIGTMRVITMLDQLTTTLGEDHDLAVLENYLTDSLNLTGDDKNQMRLLVVTERNRLQKTAFKLGAELFA